MIPLLVGVAHSQRWAVALTVAVDAINGRYGRTLMGYGQFSLRCGWVTATHPLNSGEELVHRPVRAFMYVKKCPSLFGRCIDWVQDARSATYARQYINAGEIVLQVVVVRTQNKRVACQGQLEDMSVVAADRGIAQYLCRARKLGVANQYSLLPPPIFLEHAPRSGTVRQFFVILTALGIRQDAVSLAYPRT